MAVERVVGLVRDGELDGGPGPGFIEVGWSWTRKHRGSDYWVVVADPSRSCPNGDEGRVKPTQRFSSDFVTGKRGVGANPHVGVNHVDL
jgi:hypothetical protein